MREQGISGGLLLSMWLAAGRVPKETKSGLCPANEDVAYFSLRRDDFW